MKLAISNIAWSVEREPEVAALLQRLGVAAVEVAPSKVAADPLAATRADLLAYRRFWERHGIQIVAMQSLLFGVPGMALFQDQASRDRMQQYLQKLIEFGSILGAETLVFGSPRNRQRGDMPLEQAIQIATPFFRELGRTANDLGIWFCLEPNPVQTGCDFLTRSDEALEFVRAVDQPGFGLHLDTGGIWQSQDPLSVCTAAGSCWRHLHLSEPDLVPFGTGGVDHAPIAAAVRASGYDRWMSLEMKTIPEDCCLSVIEQAVALARQLYGSA